MQPRPCWTWRGGTVRACAPTAGRALARVAGCLAARADQTSVPIEEDVAGLAAVDDLEVPDPEVVGCGVVYATWPASASTQASSADGAWSRSSAWQTISVPTVRTTCVTGNWSPVT